MGSEKTKRRRLSSQERSARRVERPASGQGSPPTAAPARDTASGRQDAREEADLVGRATAELLESLGEGLRTPVDEIVRAARRLAAFPLEDAAREAARVVEASAESLMLLTGDLLDEPAPDPAAPFDLGAVLRETLDHVAARAGDQAIDLQMRYASDAPRRVVGNARRIWRIAANLLTGAVESARTGFVLLEVLCVERTAERTWLELRVGPAGGGITEAERSAGATSVAPQILPEFAPRDRGALALAVCEKLAASLGGAAGVRGRGGDIFWARLPFGLEADAGDADVGAALDGVRILVLGDPGPATRLIIEKVDSWGARATSFHAPEDALAAIRRSLGRGEPFEAALVHVAGADAGVERLARSIRDDASLREFPLIAVAVRGLRGDARRFTEAGYDAYLAGPVRDAVLLATLRLLRERGPRLDEPGRRAGGETLR